MVQVQGGEAEHIVQVQGGEAEQKITHSPDTEVDT
jgi:hypothetical protein